MSKDAQNATSKRQPPVPAPDPMDEIIRALKCGPRPLKDFLLCTGNALTPLLDIADRLENKGFVQRVNDGRLQLTDKGIEAAAFIERHAFRACVPSSPVKPA